jgi:glutathione S-transferase
MTDVTVFGFQRSTYVNVVRLILTEKGVPFRFHDTENEMYTPEHLARHPFGRAPVLQHGDFMLYETSAIAAYVDAAFGGPNLTPEEPRQRARMNQWISNVNAYVYPYMIYHISHERNVFPELGIEPKQAIIDRAMPIAKRCLEVMDRELADGRPFIVGDRVTLADFFLLPMLTAFSFAPEAKELRPRFEHINAWDERMGARPSVIRFRASLPPRGPIPHAREWAVHHRPLA